MIKTEKMREANNIVEVNSKDENVGGLTYQSYSWYNVNDFSLFMFISIFICIYLYSLTMILQLKEPNLSIFSLKFLCKDKNN